MDDRPVRPRQSRAVIMTMSLEPTSCLPTIIAAPSRVQEMPRRRGPPEISTTSRAGRAASKSRSISRCVAALTHDSEPLAVGRPREDAVLREPIDVDARHIGTHFVNGTSRRIDDSHPRVTRAAGAPRLCDHICNRRWRSVAYCLIRARRNSSETSVGHAQLPQARPIVATLTGERQMASVALPRHTAEHVCVGKLAPRPTLGADQPHRTFPFTVGNERHVAAVGRDRRPLVEGGPRCQGSSARSVDPEVHR